MTGSPDFSALNPVDIVNLGERIVALVHDVTVIGGRNRPEDVSSGIRINGNDDPTVQFTALANEPGHLYLGRPGRDCKSNVSQRPYLITGPRDLKAGG